MSWRPQIAFNNYLEHFWCGGWGREVDLGSILAKIQECRSDFTPQRSRGWSVTPEIFSADPERGFEQVCRTMSVSKTRFGGWYGQKAGFGGLSHYPQLPFLEGIPGPRLTKGGEIDPSRSVRVTLTKTQLFGKQIWVWGQFWVGFPQIAFFGDFWAISDHNALLWPWLEIIANVWIIDKYCWKLIKKGLFLPLKVDNPARLDLTGIYGHRNDKIAQNAVFSYFWPFLGVVISKNRPLLGVYPVFKKFGSGREWPIWSQNRASSSPWCL